MHIQAVLLTWFIGIFRSSGRKLGSSLGKYFQRLESIFRRTGC